MWMAPAPHFPLLCTVRSINIYVIASFLVIMSSASVLTAQLKKLNSSSSPIVAQQAVVGIFHAVTSVQDEQAIQQAISACLCHPLKVVWCTAVSCRTAWHRAFLAQGKRCNIVCDLMIVPGCGGGSG